MKTIYKLGMLVLGAILFAGCSSDDEPVVEPTLKVIENAAEFTAIGGDAIIRVESELPITATSENTDWCTVTVDGKTVNVTATVNATVDSRSTMINISNGSKSLRIPVYQLGDIFSCDLADHVFPTSGGTCEFALNTLRECTVTGLPDWMTYTIANGKLTFTAQAMPDDGSDRKATVTLTCGKGDKMVAVFTQNTLMKLEGTYTYYCKDINMEEHSGTTQITKNSDGTYSMSPCPYRESTGNPYRITINYSEETRQMSIAAGQKMEDWGGGVFLYLVANDLSEWEGSNALEKGSVTDEAQVTYSAYGTYDKNGKRRFELQDNGSWGDLKVSGFSYIVPSGGYYWQYGVAYDLVLVQQ